MHDKTMTFSVHDDRENEMKEILTTVYDALKQKGYNRPRRAAPGACEVLSFRLNVHSDIMTPLKCGAVFVLRGN